MDPVSPPPMYSNHSKAGYKWYSNAQLCIGHQMQTRANWGCSSFKCCLALAVSGHSKLGHFMYDIFWVRYNYHLYPADINGSCI